jgi:hypothetical protein
MPEVAMRLPRFKLRSLLVLVLVAGLGLSVAVLSVQNHRLRLENARLQSARPNLSGVQFLASLDLGFPVLATPPQTLSLSLVSKDLEVFSASLVLDEMPNGSRAFAPAARRE